MEKFYLINVSKLKFVKAAESVRQLEYWAELKCKDQEFRIQDNSNRAWCVFSAGELSWIYLNANGPSGKWTSYEDAVRSVTAFFDMQPLDGTSETELVERLGYELPPTVLASKKDLAGNKAALIQHEASNSQRMGVHIASGVNYPSTDAPIPTRPASVRAQQSSNQPQSDQESDEMAKAAVKKKTAPKKAAAKAAPKAKAPKADRIEQNGVVRPKAGGLCAQVWDIADQISKKHRKPADAASVLEAGEKAGLKASNIRIEYQRWKKFNGIEGRVPSLA